MVGSKARSGVRLGADALRERVRGDGVGPFYLIELMWSSLSLAKQPLQMIRRLARLASASFSIASCSAHHSGESFRSEASSASRSGAATAVAVAAAFRRWIAPGDGLDGLGASPFDAADAPANIWLRVVAVSAQPPSASVTGIKSNHLVMTEPFAGAIAGAAPGSGSLATVNYRLIAAPQDRALPNRLDTGAEAPPMILTKT